MDRLIDTFIKYKAICHFELYGYCLMDNHIHLLIKETEEPISNVIKRICSSYVYWYNMKYERVGHLFQDRFRSENVESLRYFLTVLRYIHQNPYKAGLVKSVFDWRWSSLHEYVGKGSLVDIDKGLHLFHPNRQEAIQLFIANMMEENDDQCLDDHVKVKMLDSEVREYLHEYGITSISLLQQMDKADRNDIIAKLKTLRGVSIRQISRVTGISKSVIDRIR